MDRVDFPDISDIKLVGHPGWTQPHEVACLIWLARQTDPAGSIVEIGCNNGQTTLELATAFPDRPVIGVDYTTGLPTMVAEQRGERPHQSGELARHLPNVTILDQPSGTLDYGKLPWPSFVFIDGDHSFVGVKRDSELALDALVLSRHKRRARMIIAWHDYYTHAEAPKWVGVRECLDRLVDPFFNLAWIRQTCLVYAII